MNDCECAHIIDISNRQSDNPRNWIQTQQADTNRLKQEVLCGIKSKSRCFRGSRGCRLQRVDRCVLAKSDRSCMYAVCPVCCIVCSMLIVGLWAYSTSAQGCDLSKFPQGVCNPPAIFGSWVSECLARKQRFFSLPSSRSHRNVTPRVGRNWRRAFGRARKDQHRSFQDGFWCCNVHHCNDLVSNSGLCLCPQRAFSHSSGWSITHQSDFSKPKGCAAFARALAGELPKFFFHQNLETWKLFFSPQTPQGFIIVQVALVALALPRPRGQETYTDPSAVFKELKSLNVDNSDPANIRFSPKEWCLWSDVFDWIHNMVDAYAWYALICIELHWYALSMPYVTYVCITALRLFVPRKNQSESLHAIARCHEDSTQSDDAKLTKTSRLGWQLRYAALWALKCLRNLWTSRNKFQGFHRVFPSVLFKGLWIWVESQHFITFMSFSFIGVLVCVSHVATEFEPNQIDTPMDYDYFESLNLALCVIDGYQSALTIGQCLVWNSRRDDL